MGAAYNLILAYARMQGARQWSSLVSSRKLTHY